MRKLLATATLSAILALCTGLTCTIDPSGWTGGDTLSDFRATITIEREVGDSTADVSASIVSALGLTAALDSGQYVKVNGVELVGPTDGAYTATVDSASSYAIAARDPSRGEETTTLDAPRDFGITAPGPGGDAALSGFTLRWSWADSSLQVEIQIAQTLFGEQTVRTYGPFTDTGRRDFTAAELIPYFFQGEDLSITVTKISTASTVRGFQSGTASSKLTASSTATPRS